MLNYAQTLTPSGAQMTNSHQMTLARDMTIYNNIHTEDVTEVMRYNSSLTPELSKKTENISTKE